MARTDCVILSPRPITTEGLRVEFAHTRTELLSARLEVDQGEPVDLSVRGRSARMGWQPRTIGGGARARLVVAYRGVSPVLAGAEWTVAADGGDEPVVVLVPARPGREADPRDIASKGVRASFATVARDSLPGNGGELSPWDQKVREAELAFRERDEAIEAHSRCRRFFARMDRDTDPYMAPTTFGSCVMPLQVRLWDRVCARASLGPPLRVPELRSLADLRTALVRIGQIFGAAASDCIGVDPGRERLAWAFELFAAGRLETLHADPLTNAKLSVHGVPDSLNFFMFAEVALASLELSPPVEPDLWEPLLPALVRTCAILMHKPVPGWDHQRNAPPALEAGVHESHLAPMRWVFAVRAAFAESLPADPAPRRALLEDVFTYLAGQTIQTSMAVTGRYKREAAVPPALTRAALEQRFTGVPAGGP